MKPLRLLIPIYWLVILFLTITSAMQENTTYDEKVHLASGYSYWKTGIFRLNIFDHPPLSELIEGFPLTYLGINFPYDHPSWKNKNQYVFGDRILYHSEINADKILFSARLPVICLSLILCFFVYWWAKRLYGEAAGLLAGLLYTFCPNMLTHSHLATTDFPSTVFVFLAVYSFWEYYNNPTRIKAVLSGVCLGLALAAKFSALILIPLIVIIFLFITPSKGTKMTDLLIFAVAAFLALDVCYGVTQINLYFEGFNRVFSDISARGRSAFLFGNHSNEGWWYYFPLAFLIKTPIPLLIFILYKMYIFVKKRAGRNEWFLLLPILVWFGSACTQKLNIGLRHILPVYPFLFVWVSEIVSISFSQKKVKPVKSRRGNENKQMVVAGVSSKPVKIVFSVLVLWYVFSAVKTYPYYIAYFNEFVGGPKNGYKCLVDSNIDWGQDLKRLKQYLEQQNVDEIYLSYFGEGDPNYHGIKHLPIGFITTGLKIESTATKLPDSKHELFAISVTNLQGVYFGNKNVFGWLKKKVPVKVVGYSIFVYDITNDSESHQKLGQLFESIGNLDQARKEYARARRIVGLK